ncbi:hypothetical protein M427DRAFT_39233 [Gonapodya prolifera JEL478]|uniref:Uncharacterized protein n=1 Tax=Gonapodya prolifera (strain JEL478) TaxID=1344416 RepID=A0A138ZXK6_GONPJ|nr:hypothetical protein M427DRAFT_39233 [Gonapodya prolifera JEL478]|eukprot:KXS09236.1 hypothetical protein M427DRAFT_39233 [Gonapodya prolifera JEL478]
MLPRSHSAPKISQVDTAGRQSYDGSMGTTSRSSNSDTTKSESPSTRRRTLSFVTLNPSNKKGLSFPRINFKSNLIRSLDTNTFAIEFDPADPWTPRLSSPRISTTVKLPVPLRTPIKTLQLRITLVFGDVEITKIETENVAVDCSFEGSEMTLTFDLDASPMVVSDDRRIAFASFLKSVFQGQGELGIFVALEAAAVASVFALGNIKISNIPFDSVVPLYGMHGLTQTMAQVGDLEIVGESDLYFDIRGKLKLHNPSNVNLIMNADINALDVIFAEEVIGKAFVPNFRMEMGECLADISIEAGGGFIASLFNADVTSVILKGSPKSTTLITPLLPAIESLYLPMELPQITLQQTVIEQVSAMSFVISFDSKDPWTPLLSIEGLQVKLMLPSAIPITVKSVNLRVKFLSDQFEIASMEAEHLSEIASYFSGQDGTIALDVPLTPLSVVKRFAALVETVYNHGGYVNLPVWVEMDITASLLHADLEFRNIHNESNFVVRGFRGLSPSLIMLSALEISGGSPETIEIAATLQLTNPSNINVVLNLDISYVIEYLGTTIGTLVLSGSFLDMRGSQATISGYVFSVPNCVK